MSKAETSRDKTLDAALAAPTGLPILPPLAAIFEIILLVVVPGLLDYFVDGFPALNDMHPHFFWLPVLLLSVQYGSVSGLLAAGTAILLANLLGWPEQEIGENHFNYLLRIWLQPVLWIATAVILGQFRLRQIERKDALARAVGELTGQRQAIAEHARNLRARCEHLERLLSTRHEPEARTLLTALGRMQSPHGETADAALRTAMSMAFGPARVAIYLDDGAALRLVERFGGSGSEPEAIIGPADDLYVAAIVDGRTLTVLDAGAEHTLGGRALAATPIAIGDGRPLGLLLLEAAAPGEIDATTAPRLAAIAALVAGRMHTSDPESRATRPPPALVAATPPPATAPWRQVRWRQGRRRNPVSPRTGGRLG